MKPNRESGCRQFRAGAEVERRRPSLDNGSCTAQGSPKPHFVPNWKVNGVWNVYFWVTEVDTLFAEFKQRGAKIDYGLEDKPYQVREFGIQDLDGYDIAFGQPIAPPA